MSAQSSFETATSSSLAGAWDDLAEEVDAPPFLRPGWFNAWMRAFGRDELRVIEVRRGAKLAAVLPMLERGRTLHSPVNWHTPGFGPVAIDAKARAELFERLFGESDAGVELSLLETGSAGQDDAVDAAHRARRRLLTRVVTRSPYIELGGDFERYERGLSRNRRKALRRHRRKLEAHGELRFEVHEGPDGLERLLERLFAVEAAGWKGRRGTAISSQDRTRRFYTDVARWAAERGWLRLAFLTLDGRAIACDFALQQGGAWYTLKAGYDEEFRSYGPGALLLSDEIAHCCGQPQVTRMELLGAEDSFKSSWTEHHVTRIWLRAFRPGIAGSVGWAGSAARERMRPLARRVKRIAR